MKNFSLLILPVLMTLTAAAQAAPSTAPRQTSTSARPLDLRAPNFFSAEWQDRLQGLAVETGNEAPESIVITPSPEQGSNTHLSRTGLGSLFWAAFHPAEAWRVLLPVEPGDGFDIYADMRLHCATYAAVPLQQAACAVPM